MNVMTAFDPYHKWLGIPPDQQPAGPRRLLGISADEDDPQVVREAALRQTAFVRQFSLGEHGEHAERILGELAEARDSILSGKVESPIKSAVKPTPSPVESIPTPLVNVTAAADRETPQAEPTPREDPLAFMTEQLAADSSKPSTRSQQRSGSRDGKPLWQQPWAMAAGGAIVMLLIMLLVGSGNPHTTVTKSLSARLQQSLVAYYPFNGNANDESGNGHHGVLSDSNKIQLAADRFGNSHSAYEIQPRASIEVSPENSLRPHANSGHVTYSMWLKPSGEGIVLNQYSNMNVGQSHFFLAVNSDHLVITGRGTKAYAPSLTTAMNEWHHYVIGYHGQTGDVEVWADGILVGSGNVELNPSSSSNQPFRIGFEPNAGANNHQTMIVDDVSIFNRSLSEEEVIELYRHGLR